MFRLARGLSLSPFRREWLVKDVVAGIVLTTLLVPQGMAYAELAGLPPITGLYTSILCRLGYAAFGPDHFFPTVEAAVTAFRAGTGADWTPAVQPEADPTTADPTART